MIISGPVCLITGVGPVKGTGGELSRRFASGGYKVAMLALNEENLRELENDIKGSMAFLGDVSNLEELVDTISQVKTRLGNPSVVIHNVAKSSRGSILELDPEELEGNFRVNTTALLYLTRETSTAMLEAGKGAILVTGNTSATRGITNWGFFASTKAAQRILSDSIAREFGLRGIHTAYFIIDALIDTPRTRPTLGAGRPDEFFAKASAIAEEMFRVAHQDGSTWSFTVGLRPFGEVW